MQIRVLAFVLLCFSRIQALDSSPLSPPLPSQTATITTLPPAQPSSNDSNPCEFTDRSALLDRAVSDWQGYNISLLVEKCPNICLLIYGDGNPDVSGIGILISYILQFISTVLLGPGLLYLLALKSSYSDGFNQFLSMLITDIMPVVDSGNNWIMVSIMVASIIRISQHPPVFETDFITMLLWLQWLMTLARTVTACVLAARFDETHSPRRAWWWSILLAFIALISTFVVSLSAGYPAGKAQTAALVAISRFCAFENELPVPLYVDEPKQEKPQLALWQGILIELGSPFIYMGLIVVVTIVGALLATIAKNLWARLSNALRRQLKSLGLSALSALIVLLYLLPGVLWLTVCMWLLTAMQGARNDLQMALGKQYQDSYWGFGQVTVVVMLLPSVFDVVSKIIKFRPTTREPQVQAKTVSHEAYDGAYDGAYDEAHGESQPILSFPPDDLRPSKDQHITIQSDFPTFSEGRNYETSPAGESSSRSSRTPGAIVLQDGGSKVTAKAEEIFELKQRANTLPKDEEGNILPLHNAR